MTRNERCIKVKHKSAMKITGQITLKATPCIIIIVITYHGRGRVSSNIQVSSSSIMQLGLRSTSGKHVQGKWGSIQGTENN